jgi:hypothetical protein
MPQRHPNQLLGNIYMQILHQRNMLIKEQQLNDINPKYELAEATRNPLHIA